MYTLTETECEKPSFDPYEGWEKDWDIFRSCARAIYPDEFGPFAISVIAHHMSRGPCFDSGDDEEMVITTRGHGSIHYIIEHAEEFMEWANSNRLIEAFE